MVFSSPIFLFIFLPVLIVVYFLVRAELRNFVLLLFSLLFYAWGEPRFVFTALICSLFDWFIAKLIYKYDQNAPTRKALLFISIVLNVALLCYYKYFNFFIENVNLILIKLGVSSLNFTSIVLPIGISFFVFHKIAYLVDVYKMRGKPADNFVTYLLYIFIFPPLISGPILQYHDMEPQLLSRNIELTSIMDGIKRFSFGLAKKVFIADTLAEVANIVFSLPQNQLGFSNAWIGILCFTFQIFFDFAGYSDMAIGLGKIFGFTFKENFNSPYISKSFTEFWRRWHISLSSWIKEYIYIPLGGNRKSVSRTYFNLWVCFFVSGLWHGAQWTFVIWGAYHGLFMVLDKILYTKKIKIIENDFVHMVLTFFFIVISWVIFRADSFHQVGYYLQSMFNPLEMQGKFIYLTNNIKFFFIIAIVISFFPGTKLYKHIMEKYCNSKFDVGLVIASLLLVISICKVAAVDFSPFLYFKF